MDVPFIYLSNIFMFGYLHKINVYILAENRLYKFIFYSLPKENMKGSEKHDTLQTSFTVLGRAAQGRIQVYDPLYEILGRFWL